MSFQMGKKFLWVLSMFEGYSKMVKLLNSANKCARVIHSHVSQYNKLVNDLELSIKPSWLSVSLLHVKLDVNELLSLDADDECWEQMWESLWNTSWMLTKKLPPFIADLDICRGIVAVLSLACINEEKQQLAHEELNAHAWIFESVDRLLQVEDDIHCAFPHNI